MGKIEEIRKIYEFRVEELALAVKNAKSENLRR